MPVIDMHAHVTPERYKEAIQVWTAHRESSGSEGSTSR
jgi:hypothetical protein